MIDLDELGRLARAAQLDASPPWKVGHPVTATCPHHDEPCGSRRDRANLYDSCGCDITEPHAHMSDAVAEFIAAVDPCNALALVARIRELERKP